MFPFIPNPAKATPLVLSSKTDNKVIYAVTDVTGRNIMSRSFTGIKTRIFQIFLPEPTLLNLITTVTFLTQTDRKQIIHPIFKMKRPAPKRRDVLFYKITLLRFVVETLDC